jgi:multidrug efflux pump subunit AcrA (membrane-fusion protein)
MVANILKSTWVKVAAAAVVIIGVGIATPWWWPTLSGWVDATLAAQRSGGAGSHGHDDHAGHDHGEAGHAGHDHAHEAGHSEESSLELTPQARANLGLTPENVRPIQLTTFWRTISVPAVIVPKPGRSQIVVSSPLSGIVTHVHAVTGEAVMPGDLLFEVRLTYEDLVETQTQYLKIISELEVENREVARLEQAAQSGAISGKSLLDRRYAKEKLEASLRAQREALRLHGLSDRQIDAIGQQGKLLQDLQIVAPDLDRHDEKEEIRLSQSPYRPISMQTRPSLPTQTATEQFAMPQSANPQFTNPQSTNPQAETSQLPQSHPLVIDGSLVHKGQSVAAGEKLCTLSDYTQMYIEGKAFEQDVAAVSSAVQRGWSVSAKFPDGGGSGPVDGLKIAYVGNSIDPASRKLSVFVELPNEVLSDTTNAEGQRFINWKYRLGQRLELTIPVEQWPNQIVLPVEAVVKDGADWYAFVQNGSHFHRTPVHVQYRDQTSAVIANDGSLFPGDVVAMRSAHQMQMALKNKSGGGVDPHAGHNH